MFVIFSFQNLIPHPLLLKAKGSLLQFPLLEERVRVRYYNL